MEASRLWSTRRGEILALAGLFGLTALYLAIQAARIDSYAIFVDELLYTKAAQGFADSPFGATVFSEPYPVPNALYARLIALPYALLGNLNAFTAAHVLNALVFASAAIPVYLLARLLGASPRWALAGGALGVWVPWGLATLALMSESLAYPAFAWALLAGVVAIADPRPRNDAFLIVALLAMVYARTQFVVVLPAFALALAAHELTWPQRTAREGIARLRAHWLLGAGFVLGALVLGLSQSELLGNYARAAEVPRFPPGLLDSMADHLAHITLGIGIVPALGWAVAIVRWGGAPASRAEHAFAYLSGLAVLLLVYQSGFYSRQIAGGVLQERYAFYVIAAFAAGTAAFFARPPRVTPVGPLLAISALAVPIVGSALFPVDFGGARAILSAASNFNPELIDFASSLRPGWTTSGTMAALVVVAALLIGLALVLQRRTRFALPGLVALTLVFCAIETHVVFDRSIPIINHTIPAALGNPPKAWVDGLLYRGDDEAGVIEGQISEGDPSSLWQWTEFWNSRITRVYTLPGRSPYSLLPGTPMQLDQETGRITTEPELPMLVVSATDPTIAIRGEEIRTTETAQRLLRPERPYRADWMYGDTTTTAVARRPTDLSLYARGAGGGTATVRLELVASGKQAVQYAAVTGDERRTGVLEPGAREAIELAVRILPGEPRAVVSLSATDASKQRALVLRAVAVEWGS